MSRGYGLDYFLKSHGHFPECDVIRGGEHTFHGITHENSGGPLRHETCQFWLVNNIIVAYNVIHWKISLIFIFSYWFLDYTGNKVFDLSAILFLYHNYAWWYSLVLSCKLYYDISSSLPSWELEKYKRTLYKIEYESSNKYRRKNTMRIDLPWLLFEMKLLRLAPLYSLI